MYDKLVTKVNAIDTRGFVFNTRYNTDKPSLEKKINDADEKIIDISELVKKTIYYTKTSEIKGKIPSFSGLATTAAALTAVGNKIPSVSNLVKKADYDAKISNTESKYFTMSGYTNLRVIYLMQR